MSVVDIYASPTNVEQNECSLEAPVFSESIDLVNSNTSSPTVIVLPELNFVKSNTLKAQGQEYGNTFDLSSNKSSFSSPLSLVPWGVKSLSSVLPVASSNISRSTLSPLQRLRAESGALCAICLEDFINEDNETFTIANCSHTFHLKCIRRWKKEEVTCPLCRGPLPEELGITSTVEQNQPSDILQRILNWLALENENTVTRRDKITNLILTPFGLAWVLLIIPLLLMLETLCLFFISPVALAILLAQTCNESFNHYYDLFVRVSLIIFLTVISFVLLAAVIYTLQIPFLIYILITFCFDVLKCKRKWQDAHSYVARKLIFGTMYTELLENEI